jgi:D-alanine-D-alanine ligase
VSLVSGAGVAKVLAERGYEVRTIDVRHDLCALVAELSAHRPDAVFNALHGRGGEDGTIQGVLDILELPYTHSGVLASAIAIDKAMTKRLLAGVGIRSPKGLVVSRASLVEHGHPLEPPYVLKPVDEGSTVGVRIVHRGANSPLEGDFGTAETLLAEEFIPGRELTVGVMGTPDEPTRALAVTEIRFTTPLYDYTAKYTAGHAVHTLPAQLPDEVTREAKRMAEVAHDTLGCRGVSRSDFRWDDSKPGIEGLYFLEVNNQPGMTPLSLVPEQAAFVGMDYGTLVSWLVENAVCRHR